MEFSKHWAAVLDDYVIDLTWKPDGQRLAAASAAGSITIFDAANGHALQQLTGHADGTNVLAWSPDGASLASGGQDGYLRIWDPSTGHEIAATRLGSAWVEHLAWPRRGQTLLAAAGRKINAVRSDGSIARELPESAKTITALAWKPDGSCCAVAQFGKVVLWDIASGTALKEYAYGNAILALTWSPDGRWLVAGCQDNAVHLWAPIEDLELHMSGYETKLRELSFSHDSKWLATGGGRDACVWDCTGAGPEGREPVLLPHGARVAVVAFQNAHSLLASADAGGEFSLWSPTRQNPLIAGARMPAAATKLAWRPDDTLLAIGTEKGHVFVFKTA